MTTIAAMLGSCLTDEIVARLLDDALADDQRDEVDSHVDSCTNCRTLLVTVGSEVDGPVETLELPWLRAGDAIGRYTVRAWLGSGGMGQVYRAHDGVLKRDVALKLVGGLADPKAPARLAAEAQAMAKLTHPNVVSVFDAGEVDGRAFIAMELVLGSTLADWLKSSAPDSEAVARLFAAAARGLSAAHAAGILHRDFKPQNVLVDSDGWVRVSDFGLASLSHAVDGYRTESDGDQRTQARGTPGYMAPECERAEPATERSDIYSFGVALTRCLALSSGSSRRLLEVAARASAADPDDRFASMQEVLAALEGRRARRAPALAVILALVTLGAAGLWWRQRESVADRCPELRSRLADLRASAAADAALGPVVAEFGGRFDAEAITVCAANDSPLREATITCLDDVLDELEAALGNAPAERRGAVIEVAPPAHCAAEARVAERPQTLAPELVKELDRRFDRAAEALFGGGATDAATAELERLAVELGDLDYPLLESSTWLALAGIYEQTRDDATTRSAATKSLSAAQRSGGGAVIFDAALHLARLEAKRDPLSPAIDEWLAVADASHRRIGLHPFHELLFSQTAGYIDSTRDNDDRALERLHHAAELSARIYGPRSPGFASALFNEATPLLKLGRAADALAKLEAARGILIETRGEEGYGFDQLLGSIGTAQMELGKPEAVATLERALELSIKQFGADGDAAARGHEALGVALLRFARPSEARRELEKSLGLWIAIGGEKSLSAANARVALVGAYRSEGRYADAVRELESAVPVLDGERPHPSLAIALTDLGEAYCELGRCRDGLAPLGRALALRVAKSGTESKDAAMVELVIGSVLYRSGDIAAGGARMRAALAILEGDDPATYADALARFAKTALRGAEREQALDRAASLLDPNDADSQTVLEKIEMARERR